MKTLYESIVDSPSILEDIRSRVLSFNKIFKIIKVSYSDDDIFDIFDYNKIDVDFDTPDINLKNVDLVQLNEASGSFDKKIKSLLKLINNVKLGEILKSPHTYIYLKLGDVFYKLIKHYVKTGNLKLLNVEVKRYDDNSFMLIIEYNGDTLSILVEKNKKQ